MNFSFSSSVEYPFPPSCPRESLLDSGYDQLVALGSLYRRYLTDTIPHLPPTFDPSVFAVRASYLPRAVESAVGFLNGFYPPNSSGETFDVTTGTHGREPLIPAEIVLGTVPPSTSSTTESDHMRALTETMRPVFKQCNLTDKGSAFRMAVADYFMTCHCSDRGYPDILTGEDIDSMNDHFDWLIDAFYRKVLKIAFWPIWELLSSEIDAILAAEKKTKFTLLSGHDVTIVTTLAGARQPAPVRRPPYASHLAIELWDVGQPSLRFVLNGNVLPVAGRDLTPLSDFSQMMEPLRPAEEL